LLRGNIPVNHQFIIYPIITLLNVVGINPSDYQPVNLSTYQLIPYPSSSVYQLSSTHRHLPLKSLRLKKTSRQKLIFAAPFNLIGFIHEVIGNAGS
jgi:hypothetical protein